MLRRFLKVGDSIEGSGDDKGCLSSSEPLFLKVEEVMVRQRLYRNPNLSLVALARMVGVNRTYLYRSLSCRGLTFYTYVGSFRLQEAMLHIGKAVESGTPPDMEEIAERSGFANARAMNYYLGSTLGISLSCLRRRCELAKVR